MRILFTIAYVILAHLSDFKREHSPIPINTSNFREKEPGTDGLYSQLKGEILVLFKFLLL